VVDPTPKVTEAPRDIIRKGTEVELPPAASAWALKKEAHASTAKRNENEAILKD
jgi:hypothetical protein